MWFISPDLLTLMNSDIKPHNFVLTRDTHILIDFGSAAPLLPPGTEMLSPFAMQYLRLHFSRNSSSARRGLEMEDETDFHSGKFQDIDTYGQETDWWSLGAMVYEMAYGVAPIFRSTL